MMICIKCGEPLPEGAATIEGDGAPLACARCAAQELQAEAEKLQATRLEPLVDMIDKVGLSHEREKALMAKERQAIVAWLRRLAGDTNPIAKLIEDGQHWKDQP